jgi:hypothetical protein
MVTIPVLKIPGADGHIVGRALQICSGPYNKSIWLAALKHLTFKIYGSGSGCDSRYSSFM